jgi:hypothetical protein
MKYRTAWYAEQQEAAVAMRIAKMPVGRKRRAPNGPESWNALRALSTRLSRTLEDLLQLMHEAAPGERTPELSVSLIADLAEEPPATIEPPARSKPVNPMGRHRIALGGKVEANTVIARLEVTAKVTIWAAPGDGAESDGMTRFTWVMPRESAEKREKRYEKLQDGK